MAADEGIMMIVHCRSLSPQRGEMSPKRRSLIEPLNQIELARFAGLLVPSPLGGERVRVRGENS